MLLAIVVLAADLAAVCRWRQRVGHDCTCTGSIGAQPPTRPPPLPRRSPDRLNWVWRVSYGIGLIPIAFMLFW